jgi:hypothetical protein
MIPVEADRGLTLQDKEGKYIGSAAGIIFLLTPGAERFEKYFPSPSVTDEMGQAKQKFSNTPERIIYMKDVSCNIQAIDQRCYIPFDRGDIRSVIECLTSLVRSLRESGLLVRQKIQPRETPGIDIPALAESLDWTLKDICFYLSGKPNGAEESPEFASHLKNIYKMDDRNLNFVERELLKKGLVTTIKSPYGTYFWTLTNVGWEIARLEAEGKERRKKMPIGELLQELVEKTSKDVLKKYQNSKTERKKG